MLVTSSVTSVVFAVISLALVFWGLKTLWTSSSQGDFGQVFSWMFAAVALAAAVLMAWGAFLIWVLGRKP
jgi:hypothetical protein